MDQSIRNRLRSVVTQCRKLLEEAVRQVLQGQFGIYETGKKDEVHVEDESRMKNLSEEDKGYRRDIQAHLGHIQALGYKAKDALAQLVREIAFTHLNRLCAYKMMEARAVWIGGKPFRESVSRGMKSQGFQFYLADHPEDKQRFDTGHQDVAYRHYLSWLGALLSEEIGVLFSPTDPANRLFPPQRVLDDVLALINSDDLKDIWTEDETIGWVYQYFTPKELRDAARDPKKGGSQAPRNSYELAFRNQFFTPRYVVEFLSDNTLGRIWYEMRKGDTKLKELCHYMVRRPNEVFLAEGQTPLEPPVNQDALLQEELLKQSVHIPHRPKKDPREIRILDPACGSGHFLLYCFYLLLTIYEEAYADPDLGPKLQEDYPTLDALRHDVPRLILAHNLHGIDIDLRCTQIAALALWLRCQRAYGEMGLKQDRPKITKSNIVCAEPMPGENEMLKEFVGQLEPKLLGQVVEVVFDKMKLAGEAGSLLKIEEDIRDALAAAKKQWVRETIHATDRKGQPLLFTQAAMDRLAGKPIPPSLFDLSDITDDQFFEQAEEKVVDALRRYAEKAHNGQQLQRRLFTEDAVRGFAFVDICHKRYDVVLMNPPFGLGVKRNFAWLKTTYPDGYVDLLSAFVARASDLCLGIIGAITSRSIVVTKKLERLRSGSLLPRITTLLDLGWAVMDGATVQSCAYTIARSPQHDHRFVAIDRMQASIKTEPMLIHTTHNDRCYLPDRESLRLLPRAQLLYALPARITTVLQSETRLRSVVLEAKHGMNTFNNFRFLRLRWEVSPDCIGENLEWEPLSKGGPFALFYSDLPLLVRWSRNGNDIAEENRRANGQTAQARQASTYYRIAGGTYSRRSSKDFGVRVLPAGCIIGEKGPAVLATGAFSKEFIIGLLNSRLMNSLVHIQANAKQYDSGILERLPWIQPSTSAIAEIEMLTEACIRAVRSMACMSEIDSGFCGVAFSHSLSETVERWKASLDDTRTCVDNAMSRISEVVDSVYAVDSRQLTEIVFGSIAEVGSEPEVEVDEDDDDDGVSLLTCSQIGVAQTLMSISVGCLMGRWSTCSFLEQLPTAPDDLFGPIPNVPPISALATVKNGDLNNGEHHTDRSIADRDGIIVDDVDSTDDIVLGTRRVLEHVWTDCSDSIESEACKVLAVKELRDYFRKAGKGGFWDDHVSRYSKSRRKAPIYWLLQSSKKNYGLWLYYHRLDKDILFKARQNYVDPKSRLEQSRLDSLRTQKTALGADAKGAKKIDKEIEKQETLLGELKDFAEKLERAAKLNFGNPDKLNSEVVYDPDLNDGVVLNIAALWELVPWKEAKNYWEELLEGKYDWSSMGKLLRKKGLVK